MLKPISLCGDSLQKMGSETVCLRVHVCGLRCWLLLNVCKQKIQLSFYIYVVMISIQFNGTVLPEL